MIADIKSDVDVAVNEPLTVKSGMKILANPLTWLPALSYLTSFGFELCIDSFLVNYLFGLFSGAVSLPPSLYQLRALMSVLSTNLGRQHDAVRGRLLHIDVWFPQSVRLHLPQCQSWFPYAWTYSRITRPAGGIIADALYKKYGVVSKKYWMLFNATAQGLVSIGLGVYLNQNTSAGTIASGASRPDLSTVMGLGELEYTATKDELTDPAVSLIAIFNEMANGANFALVYVSP